MFPSNAIEISLYHSMQYNASHPHSQAHHGGSGAMLWEGRYSLALIPWTRRRDIPLRCAVHRKGRLPGEDSCCTAHPPTPG